MKMKLWAVAVIVAVLVTLYSLYFSRLPIEQRRRRVMGLFAFTSALFFMGAAYFLVTRYEEGIESNLPWAAPASLEQDLELAPTTESLPSFLSEGTDDIAWPGWRGDGMDNRVSDSDLSLASWDPKESGWQVAIDGIGHSTPCVAKGRVILSFAKEGPFQQYVVAYDLLTGKKAWQTRLAGGDPFPKHAKNSYATPSVTCDDQYIYVLFQQKRSLFLHALDHSGTSQWSCNVGPYSMHHGAAASPILYKSLVIVAGEGETSPFLAAVGKRSGRLYWRHVLRETDWSFGTPVVAHIANRDQLLLSTKDAVCSFDPATGKELWTCRWPIERTANSVAYQGDYVYATSTRMDNTTLCIQADGQGDVTDTHVKWRSELAATYVASPLCAEGMLWLVSENGILTCLDLESGAKRSRVRLGGNYTSSPLLIGDQVILGSEQGVVSVLDAKKPSSTPQRHDLQEPIFASPVFVDGDLILRTTKSLICLRQENEGGGKSDVSLETPLPNEVEVVVDEGNVE